MRTPKQLNEIIKEMKPYDNDHLPYTKGMIYKRDVIRILKKYVDYNGRIK